MLAAWNSFVLTERNRQAVPGMARMYQKHLAANPGAPIIYLSTGAWNTLPFLNRFLARHGFPKGVFLIEIKSWSGRVAGDQGQWVQRRRDGSVESFRNPASTNAAKVRSLASLIKRNWSPAATRDGVRAPFIQSLVWFSNPTLEVALPPELRPHIAIADNNLANARDVLRVVEAMLFASSAPLSPSSMRERLPEGADVGGLLWRGA